MKITIVGGGNSTLLLAPQAVVAGHEVSIFTRKPELWSKDRRVSFKNLDKNYLGGKAEVSAVMKTITNDPEKCMKDVDMIIFAGIPTHVITANLMKLLPSVTRKEKTLIIASVCAYGGFNWQVSKAVKQMTALHPDFSKIDIIITGFQAIPWSCGNEKYGHIGLCYGHKDTLQAVSELLTPSSDRSKRLAKKETEVFKVLADILQIPLSRWTYTSFLVATLYPNNPVFHPPIEYGLFKDWDFKTPYILGETCPVHIYKDLSMECADYMCELNRETCTIVDCLKTFPNSDKLLDNPGFDLLQSLIIAFGDGLEDKSSVYKAIRTNPAYQRYKNPYKVVKEEAGKTYVIPNLEHRFYTSDVSTGLVTYKDIAIMCGIQTPLMDKVINWHERLLNKEYMVNGQLTGKDIDECILPSLLGYSKHNLHLAMHEVSNAKL